MLAIENKEVNGNRELLIDIKCKRKPSEKGIEKKINKYKADYAWVREEYISDKAVNKDE